MRLPEPVLSPTSCPLCNVPGPRATGDTHIDSQILYSLYDCTACSVQFWWPLKNPGATWYEHDPRYADRNQDPILHPSDTHRGVVAYFAEKPGRVLDVGCGNGNFLVHAQKHGWEGWGIDFDADAVRAGKDILGLKHLEVADIGTFAASHSDLRFNLITFFDVLEHIDDHSLFMGHINALLEEKGHIAFSMPYRHGWRWLIPHDLPPRHLTRWDERAIRKFLTRQGYDLVYLRRLPASFYFLVMKLRFRFGKWASFGLVGRLKRKVREEGGKSTSTVHAAQMAAKTKDMLIFGLPALIIWLCLLPSRKRHTDFYVIAQKRGG